MGKLTLLTIFSIWTNEAFLSVWAVNYCCEIYDDPNVRKFINTPICASKYKRECGKKDKRILKIIDKYDKWEKMGMFTGE